MPPLRPVLSVIIPVYNDEDQCNKTLESLYGCTDHIDSIEVIVIDDFSDAPYVPSGPVGQPVIYRLRRNEGPAVARQYGMTVARGEWCLHIDSHMLFHKGWYNKWRSNINADGDSSINNLYCGTYVTVSSLDHEELSVGGGAHLTFFDFKDNHPRILEVDPVTEGAFFGNYRTNNGPGSIKSYEVPCSTGASYFFHRETYFRLKGLVGLIGWGCEEQMMSLKYWLSGGSVKVMPDVRIAHVYQGEAQNRVEPWRVLYNKLLVLWHILGPDMAWHYFSFVRHEYAPRVKEELVARSEENTRLCHALAKECFVHDIDWYCSRFNISHPEDLKGALLSA